MKVTPGIGSPRAEDHEMSKEEQAAHMLYPDYPPGMAIGYDASLNIPEMLRNAFMHGVEFRGWISVSDRLPPQGDMDDVYVLAYLCKFGDLKRFGYCQVLSYENGEWLDEMDNNVERNADNYWVTHWQPLPEPPK